jgi:hypothetical protein
LQVHQQALKTLSTRLDPKIVRASTIHVVDGEARLPLTRPLPARRSQRGAR